MAIENEKVEPHNNDEIDIKLIIKFILRNKIFISYFAIIFFFASALYSLTLKRVWEGEFQIVLDDTSNSNVINSPVRSFLDINKPNNLDTEVGILESPSTLMPVFEIANKKYLSSGKPGELIFSKWKKNLVVKLKKDTSILNISYRDTDKEIILPILKKMTSTYQDYSGKKKKRRQELTSQYLIEQLDIYTDKSAASLKTVQEYAIDQDLLVLDFQDNKFAVKKESESENFNFPNIGIEIVRVNAANEIRQIDSQIMKIEEIGDDYKKLQYIGSTIPGLVEEGLPSKLSEIEKLLAEMSLKYTDKNLKIIKQKQRDLLVKLLKSRAIGYLEAKKLKAESLMESAMRPKGVLLKYKELMRQAERDELTLVSLENQLRIINLEQAKIEDPWELITKPTLLKNPVGPSRKNISLLGTLVGLFTGTLVAKYREYLSKNIYEKNNITKILSTPFCEFININDQVKDTKDLVFFSEYIKIQKKKRFHLLL